MTALRYVYGIVPSSAAGSIDAARLVGIDGSTVRALADGPFAAAQSELDPREWGPDALNRNVADMEWLTPRAEAHQRVNARLLDLAGAVLPLSFGTLYRDEARVREMLREDAAARQARLDQLSGRAEWVVTVVRGRDAAPASDDDLSDLDREIAASSPGRGYLLEKRRTRIADAASERADADAARRALDALTGVSERTYREPVATGGDDVVALRVSLLAPRTDTERIAAAIGSLGEDLGASGYRVRVSGPWPAYRFGSLP